MQSAKRNFIHAKNTESEQYMSIMHFFETISTLKPFVH